MAQKVPGLVKLDLELCETGVLLFVKSLALVPAESMSSSCTSASMWLRTCRSSMLRPYISQLQNAPSLQHEATIALAVKDTSRLHQRERLTFPRGWISTSLEGAAHHDGLLRNEPTKLSFEISYADRALPELAFVLMRGRPYMRQP